MADTPTPPADAHSPAHRTPALLVAAAWLFVGIPAAWGVSQTFRQALKLFQHAPPAATGVNPPTTQSR